jgi:arabinogalactan oligomer/maltooligosaccharide transport system permease protein
MATISLPTLRPDRAPPGGLGRRLRQSRTAWAYIAPAMFIMGIISVFPQLYQVGMSLTDFRIQNLRFNLFNAATYAKYAPSFVGLDNFVRILNSTINVENYNFVRLLAFNLTWTFANVAFHVGLGVLIALALNNRELIGRRFYRALFIIPWALPGYITALTWKNMYDDRFGAINQLAEVANRILGTSLATDTRWMVVATPPIGGLLSFLPLAFYAVLLANVWLGWPFMTVVATGALQSISSELYEAAEMDGASGWQKFWRITAPLIRPAMVPAIMLGTIWTFNQFNVIYFISEGDPSGRTEILVTQAFKLVYEKRLYGLAAAFSLVVFVILLIITLINNRITRATEAYDVA